MHMLTRRLLAQTRHVTEIRARLLFDLLRGPLELDHRERCCFGVCTVRVGNLVQKIMHGISAHSHARTCVYSCSPVSSLCKSHMW